MVSPKDAQVREVVALMDGGMSENAACAQVGINRGTFRHQAAKVLADSEYAGALASLARDQAEKLEQTIDDMRAGVIDHQMARVEIDARKWFASKFLPKQFGDKTQIVGGDPDAGDKPIQHAVEATVVFRRPE